MNACASWLSEQARRGGDQITLNPEDYWSLSVFLFDQKELVSSLNIKLKIYMDPDAKSRGFYSLYKKYVLDKRKPHGPSHPTPQAL